MDQNAGDTGERPTGMLRRLAILFVAAACGWMVMQMEILGGRALTPYFGSDVYVVMGSVIGVFLLSLAAGYALGGWLSGLRASEAALGLCIAIAGAWSAAVPLAAEPLSYALLDAKLGVRWGSLAAAFALFGVPTALLGTVSPTAVRWLTHSAADSGRTAGLVLAFSTVASFAGCLVAAFYLVLLSLRLTFYGSGALLMVLGLAVVFHAVLRGRAAGRGAK